MPPKKKVTREPKVTNYDKQPVSSGMLTSVWGPGMWVFLHTMSFNYPEKPTMAEKKHHRDFVYNMVHILPCIHCRTNLESNLVKYPLTMKHLKDRNTFSRYIYKLHEMINGMLGKKSGLSYTDVKNKYEYFRSACDTEASRNNPSIELGCTIPLGGRHPVPQSPLGGYAN